MERFWDLRRAHKKAWYAGWVLVVLAVSAVAQWSVSGGNPLLTEVLGAQAKKPVPPVDTTPPPAPTLTAAPDDPTFDTSPRFAYRDAEAGVSFACGLDGRTAQPCGSSINYKNVEVGDHSFSVVAIDAAGNRSGPATHTWTIVENKSFGISGSVSEQFFPGVTRPLNLVLGNPYNFSIKVTSVTVTVDAETTKTDGSANPECVGTTNLTVARQLGTTVILPPNATRSLSQLGVTESQRPQLHMPNLPVNQDACKNTAFGLSYTGTAEKS